MTYEKFGYAAALLQLGMQSVQDIKTRTISTASLLIWGFLAGCYFAAGVKWEGRSLAEAVFPGVFLLLTAFLTKEKIGYGDGLTVLLLGVWTGGLFCMIMVCLGICLSGICAVYRMIKKVREPIPFLPFLLGAMEVLLLYG